NHHGKIFVNQRVRAVLHLAGGIALGMNVGDFLQFQRTFQRDRVVNATPKKQEVVDAMIFLGKIFGLFVASQQRLQLAGHEGEVVEELLGVVEIERSTHQAKVDRKQE